MTGSMPGNAASTGETWVFGSAPKAVAAPEKSLDFAVTWAWTSRPITTSHSPVRPSISAVMYGPYLMQAVVPAEQPHAPTLTLPRKRGRGRTERYRSTLPRLRGREGWGHGVAAS